MSGSQPEPSYTVFVRLPFPRGDFVDPPPVEWDDTKDKALWKILSKASKNSDIDWRELATKFDVSLEFLLQQAAWLYERQLVQVRAQMRKVGASKGSTAPSPVPGSTSENAGGEAMRRTGSGGGGARMQSTLSSRKDSPVPRSDGSTPLSRTNAPPFSRNSSANTIQQSRHATQTSPRPAHAKLHKRSHSPLAKGRPSPIAEAEKRSPDLEQSTSPDASSSEADSDSEPPAESRILRRPPARFTANKLANSDADDDEEGPAFMPFVPASTETNRHHDLSATLRGDSKNMFRRPAPYRKSAEAAQQSQTSDSSASSIAVVARRSDMSPRDHEHAHRPGPLSPRRTAELARQSPRFKGKGREGSDGTPSMGSSFSDLDDASVTQSALEEAMASNMQAGGTMASRMSSISQAIRSRYL